MNYYKVVFPTTMTDQETELFQPLTSQRAADRQVVYMVLVLLCGWRGHGNPGLIYSIIHLFLIVYFYKFI